MFSTFSTENSSYKDNYYTRILVTTEAVAKRFSAKKVFLDISQNSQESTCARVSFLIKFFNMLAASELSLLSIYNIFKN